MHCPNCGKPIGEGQAFCGECGTRVDSIQPAPEPEPPVAPAQPMPQQPAPAAPPAYNDAAYQQQYGQQQYAQQAYQQQYPPQAYQQQYAAAQPPKSKAGLIIAVVAIAVVVVVGGGVGAFFLLRGMSDGPGTTTSSTSGTSTSSTSSSSSSSSGSSGSSGTSTEDPTDGPLTGYSTPEGALTAEYPEDWVFALVEDEGDWQIWWAGPPNSEYVDEVFVELTLDDTWVVTDSYSLDEMEFPEDEAVNTVMAFLDYIMQDLPLDAQALCIPPFSEDPASASYSNGDFLSYEILEVTGEDDGTYWVHTSEEWRWGVEEYEYWVVPTELGYYISQLKPYGY